MCGILGYFGNQESSFLNKVSLEKISHRGPDHSEFIIGEHFYLGHTRLSILDLSARGNQPMYSSDKNFSIIFNGEIYNHLELREKYLSNVNFSSTSDTETLLYGLIYEGTEFIKKLNGIFAFSFYNFETKDFIIARDHFGVKPLYYFLNDNEIGFSSEAKALLPYLKNMDYDETALKNYINFLWAPGNLTPIKQIKKLLPGNYITGNVSKINELQFTRYYSIPFDSNSFSNKSEAELIDLLEEKLVNAVQRQMLSDVPVGFFLSGGLDSSLVVAIAKKLHPKKKLDCFTIKTHNIENEGFVDDFYYADKVAKYLDVNLNVVDSTVEILNDFDKIIYFLDEPQADPAPIHVYNICKVAKEKGIKVLLGGTGGDDIFSGYRRHQALELAKIISFFPVVLRKLIKNIVGKLNQTNSLSRRLNKLTKNIDKSTEEIMLGYFDWIDQDKLNGLFLNKSKIDVHSYFKFLNTLISKEKSNLNKMLFWEINTFLVSHNLNYTDKLSMAHGVEVRVPYLDLELVEFSTTIPPKLKLNGSETKYLLKKVAERYLPKEIIYRPKTGFGGPVRKWILNDMSSMINDYLSKEAVEKRGIFDYEKVNELLEINKKGSDDLSYPIWSLLAIESWMRQFYDNKLEK